MALEKYHFRDEHCPRTQHRHANGLSKRTNDYRLREQQLEKLPLVAERWNFLSQEEYQQLPTAPLFDVQGRMIPNQPNLPSHLRHVQPTPPSMVKRNIRRTQQTKRREKQKVALQAPLPAPAPLVLHAHENFYPDYLKDWIDVTEEASQDYLLPTHDTNVALRTTFALVEATGAVLQNAPNNIKQAVLAIRDLSTVLHRHAHTVHGIEDLVLVQNRCQRFSRQKTGQ